MRDVVEGLMDTLRWLWFPALFPLGGIVVTYSVAFTVARGASRVRR